MSYTVSNTSSGKKEINYVGGINYIVLANCNSEGGMKASKLIGSDNSLMNITNLQGHMVPKHTLYVVVSTNGQAVSNRGNG